MFRHLIIVVALVAGSNASSGRIAGGCVDQIENVPYMVSLQHNGVHACGGRIVARSYILTAAHCIFKGLKLESLTVRSGTSLRDVGGLVSEVESFVRHPNHVFGVWEYDVAVIKLKEPLVFGDTRRPVALAESNWHINPGTKVLVSGYGQKEETETSDELRSVVVPIVNETLCLVAHPDLRPGQICAGDWENGDKDACQNDSGGPLVIGVVEGKDDLRRQVGIVSYGPRCGVSESPGVYTDVATYRKWIDRQLDAS